MKTTIIATLIAAACTMSAAAQGNGLKVYINPGHGGHDAANDRNVVIYPYKAGDPEGYWESNSNLDKGMALRDMLLAKGYEVEMSRVTNNDGDDLPLGTISALANKYQADIFFSIHSNATGVSARRNSPLMLYRGWDNDPVIPENLTIAQILNRQLLQNKVTYWTSTSINCRGDWSFYPNWGYQVGLGVLRGLTVKGILSEGSFHDYIPEAYRLMNKDFCWLEAWHFRKTIDEFFNQPGVEVGHIMGRVNDSRVLREGDYIMFGDDKYATVQGVKLDLYDADGKLVDSYTTHPILYNGVYAFHDLKPGTYTIKASVETHYDAETTVTVTADACAYANITMNKVRSTPPVIESYSPVWAEGDEAMLCNTPIVMQFNWDMDTELTEKAFKIEPAVEGTFTWEDLNYRLVFKPAKAYETNTLYTVTLSTEAAHAGGMKLEQPFTLKFRTTDRNFMEIIGQFPDQDEEVHYSGAAIEFRFDKLPNTSAILNQIKCTDEQGNDVAFNKRSMTNSKVGAAYGFFRIPLLKDLEVGKTYKLHLSGDFADKDGITIQKPVDVTFKAVDAGLTKPYDAIETMDSAENFTVDTTGSAMLSSATVSADNKVALFDSSVAFTYTFGSNAEGQVRFAYACDEPIVVNPTEQVGVHIYGDLTGNEVFLEFSSELSTRYVKVCDMNFLGWRYCQVAASELEGESRLTGIVLAQRESQMGHTGTFRLDHIVHSGVEGVSSAIVSGLTVNAAPGADFIIASADAVITGLRLIDMQGRTVATAAGNALRISDIAEGHYVLRVSTSNSQQTMRVMVVH